jgi:hypothetical protein
MILMMMMMMMMIIIIIIIMVFKNATNRNPEPSRIPFCGNLFNRPAH